MRSRLKNYKIVYLFGFRLIKFVFVLVIVVVRTILSLLLLLLGHKPPQKRPFGYPLIGNYLSVYRRRNII